MALAFQFRYYIVSLSFLPFILNSTHDSPMYYCVDWDCEEFISRGKTLLNYAGKTDKHLSFRQNEDIKILGKPIDESGSDWIGTVRKKVGLVPKTMVREDQMGKHDSKFRYPLDKLPLWTSDIFGGAGVGDSDSESNGTGTGTETLKDVDDDEQTLSHVEEEEPEPDADANADEQEVKNLEDPISENDTENEDEDSDVDDADADADSTSTTPTPHTEKIEQNINNVESTSEAPAVDELSTTTNSAITSSSMDQSSDNVVVIQSTTPTPTYDDHTEIETSSAYTDADTATTTPTPQIEEIDEKSSDVDVEAISIAPAADEFSTTSAPPLTSSRIDEILPKSVSDANAEMEHSNDPDAHGHDHDHGHHHHHHHAREEKLDSESSSFILIVKHISSTLLSFLPEHLQDTILDVDDALVFTGIIALTLISICVPYFLIEGFFSVRPLKKKVVELNKSLWKVSTAYENQQEEFEIYKKKALAYDEDKKRVEQLEYELVLVQKLESKQKEQVAKYQKELKTHKELTTDMQSFLDKEVEKKKKILDEKDKLKTTVTSLKEALRRTTDELQDAQLEASTAVMELELSKQSNETLAMKAGILEKEVNELKAKLLAEVERRRAAEDERDEVTKASVAVDNELLELKKICMKYEDTVSNLSTEINHKENELIALKETLGEDSPLVDIAEVNAKLMNAEEETTSLQSRVDSLYLENSTLTRNVKDATSSLSTIQRERDDALNRLQVLEAWFKEKEEDLRKAVERYEAEKNIRGKDKDDLVHMIEEKSDENKQLGDQLEAFKEEFEETKQQHRNEIRALEAKSHESWLSLCQAERKAQDARKEAEFLRQKLTAITKEKEGENEDVNGEVPMYPLITPDMVPLPLPDDTPSYFGLGDGFLPPPPLPLDGEREPHRPAPLGRLSPNYSDLDDTMLSPIRRGVRGDDYSDGDSSESDSPRRRSPRGGWVEVPHERDRHRDRDMDDRRRRPAGPRASSPINQGFNL